MKFNKILSSVLTVVMLFMAIVGIIPAREVYAATSSDSAETELTYDEIVAIAKATLEYKYESAEAMLNDELEKGYLVSSTDASGEYSIYVNKYTGILYYRNNLTGQIITSNPYSVGEIQNVDTRKELISQIQLVYNELSSTSKENPSYYSFQWAAEYAQIAVEYFNGGKGIRVNYTIGDTSNFLLPGRITAEKFESLVVVPSLNKLAETLESYCGDTGMVYSVFDNPDYDAYKNGCINRKGARSLEKYISNIKTFISFHFVPIKYTKSQTKHVCLVCMYVDKHVCMLKILSQM